MASRATRLAVAPGLDAHRVADGAAAELQHHVVAEEVEKLVHLAGMNAARRHRHDLVQDAQSCSKKMPRSRSHRVSRQTL
jgi:hypothetical protein